MMPKGKRKSATVYLAAAVILTCYLAQTIDCYRLKKTERREGRKEADSAKRIGVQEGKIVFGRVFENGSGLDSQVIDGTKKSSSNASVEDEAAYQADSGGWSRGQPHDSSSREASWRRMAPSLQCGGDQLKFRAVGPGASQFAVEQGNAPPIPLSQVPSTCGYSMQRNSLALVMLVPYDGCNMVQEGGSHVLPMRWQGVPVSLQCPKPAAPAPTTAAPQHPVPQTPRYPPSYPQVPQMPLIPHTGKNPDVSYPKIPQSYFFPPHLPYPQYPSVPVPEPTTATTKKPEMPKFPQYPPFFPPFYPYFTPPLPITTVPTTTAKPADKAPPPAFPFPFYPPFPWPFPGPLPTTAKPTTIKTTATKPQLPQSPYMPFFPPYPFFPPHIPPYPQYPTPKPETTTPTTTTTIATEKTNPPLTQSPHFHPHVHLPFQFMPYPPPYPPHLPPM